MLRRTQERFVVDRNLHGSRTKLVEHENARLRSPSVKSEEGEMSRRLRRITIRYDCEAVHKARRGNRARQA